MNSFSQTDIGNVRKLNEDFIFASDEPVGPLNNLYLVADGMGGHHGGDYASRYAVEHVVDSLRKSERSNPVAAIHDAIQIVNEELFRQGQSVEGLEGMGTTMVAATASGNTLYVANVGDSRLYCLSGHLRQVTRDHSWVEEMIREGKMTYGSEQYWEKKNIITRALGAYEQVTEDFFEVDLLPGDRFLLCSDGLTNMIEDAEIEKILRNSGSLEEAGETLVRVSKENGGKDNISLILVDPQLGEVKECLE